MSNAPRAARDIKQQRAKATRTDILQAAIDLFARRGILATTMAELARTIKMTPGALYWHFPTKEDLLLAAIDELHERYLQQFSSLLAEGRKTWTAKQQLSNFVERIHAFLRENSNHGIFFGMLSAEAAENNERVAQALRDALSVYVHALASIIRYGQKKTKEFRDDVDALTLAHSMLFANVGIIVHQHLFAATLSYDPLISTMHTVVLDGVMPRDAS